MHCAFCGVLHSFQLALTHLSPYKNTDEPVWAIGTGLTATPEMAQETHDLDGKHKVERLNCRPFNHTNRNMNKERIPCWQQLRGLDQEAHSLKIEYRTDK